MARVMYSNWCCFEDNPNQWISASKINTLYALMWIQKQITEQGVSSNINDLVNLGIELNLQLPGDVQRQLRKFYDIHGHHGIEQLIINNSPIYYYDQEIIHIDMNYEPRFISSDISASVGLITI